jgi:hypothetical protein
MRSAKILLATVICAAAWPAFACIPPPPPPRFPDETDKAYQERVDASVSAQNDEERRSYQIRLLEQAKAVFIGVASDSREIDLGGGSTGHEVTIRAAGALKGALPDQPILLRDVLSTDCGYVGGGSATFAKAGDYVIVFQGIDDGMQGGTGNVGIFASEARTPDLLKALVDFANRSRPQQ